MLAADIPGDFSIPAAPILIPEGPWKEIEGCVCAPKGFQAQGELQQRGFHAQELWRQAGRLMWAAGNRAHVLLRCMPRRVPTPRAAHTPAAGMYGGLRAKGNKADLALVVCDTDAVAAGVFTLNVM